MNKLHLLALKKLLKKQSYSMPPLKAKEIWYQTHLQNLLGGQRELSCKGIGRLDLLTDSFLIEVKFAKGWKGALGQVYCYSAYYGGRTKILALIGKPDSIINEVCRNLDIIVLNFWNGKWQIQY